MSGLKTAKAIEKKLRPEGGWWRYKTKAVVVKIAYLMLTVGMDPVDVEDWIHQLVGAMRAEYGE